MVATRIAVLRPSVRRLATIGVAGHGGVRRQTKPMVQWRGHSPEAEAAALRQNLESLMLSPKQADDELALQIHRTCCNRTRFRSRHLSLGSSLPDLLVKLSIPIHFIWGGEDTTAFPEMIATNLVGAHKERKSTTIPGAGHWTQFEAPKEVDETLIRWLSDSSPS
jgi:pimeloyl-ACP methyl ester carboxylesterase